MKKSQMKNKVSQMLYRPKKTSEEDKDTPLEKLESLDDEIDKAMNAIFGTRRKKK